MSVDLRVGGQRAFLELHALLSAPKEAEQIRELAASEVAPSRILALYPCDGENLVDALQKHLHSILRMGSFSWLMDNWAKQEKYRLMLDLLTSDQAAQCKREWTEFFVRWQSKKRLGHLDLEAEQRYFFAVFDAFGMLWVGAHWHELPQLHVQIETFNWALDEFDKALHFMNWDGPMIVDVPAPDPNRVPYWQQ